MDNWTEIAALEDIPRLGARVVRTDTVEIAVFRTAGDEVFALKDECPHSKGPLSQGIVHGATVTCPADSPFVCATGWTTGSSATTVMAGRCGTAVPERP